MKLLLTTLNAKFIQSSLALRCLSTACRHAGIDDMATAEYTINQNAYDILRHIYSYHAGVIGFSCYIWNIEMTCRIIALLKQVMPDTIIAVGGPEVSYTAQDVLEQHPYIDYVFQGEGEIMVPAFMRDLEQGGNGTTVPGVLGRVNGSIQGSEAFQEVPDLDMLPFPYENQDFSELAHKIMYYESSRGCPFHCQYCLSGMSDDVRFRSVPLVIQELQRFVEAGVHQVKFVDRTFNCNPRHHRPLIEYMLQVDRPINFHLEIEPGVLRDEDLDLLAQAPKGRIQLEMGIQSTYGPTLKAIRRYNDWPRITYIMKRLLAYGTIHLHLDLIVGLPYETYEHLQQSFNDIYALHPHKLQIGFLKLLKGSGIRRDYPEEYRYDPYGPYEVLATTWLPYEKVRYLKVFEDVFERIYNSGKFMYVCDYLACLYEPDYFHLYDTITKRWMELQYDEIAISDENLCRFLYDCIQQVLQLTAVQQHVAAQLLALDMLTFFTFRLKPDFLGWHEADRKETDAIFRDEHWMRQYIPQYVFTNWRDLKKRYRIWATDEETKAVLAQYTAVPKGAAYLLAQNGTTGVTWQFIPAYGENVNTSQSI
ncbi:MAG: B12-binding domain-containing radical SAM protein [Megasphaera sp.]|jgi:radical SAM superfamily enzyme YgiQ (UPF0313 family)|nr:B12-binding domain-containing radical SAM protein [Megasphaera sp.]MCH4187438.1 B12-binding domain-containing radical SAM protein [Megasphaera sp.]MCH4217357.1 B12-binding domain-containing radical SAM protein [Megasphaera sp.]